MNRNWNVKTKERLVKSKWNSKFATMILIGASIVMGPKLAMALTPACTPINNTATLTWKVGTTVQTPKTASSTEILVANKILHTVTTVETDYVDVTPGATDQRLNYRITNTGNANQTYKLTFTTQSGGATVWGGNDTTDINGATAPTLSTAVTAVVEPGNYVDAYLTATAAAGLTNGQIAGYGLIATAAKVDGTTTETEGVSSITSTYGECTTAEIVFADLKGSDDAAVEDGQHSANHAYRVVTTSLTFNKTATVFWDPINEATDPKPIPGALLHFEISITNGGATSAILTALEDDIVTTMVMQTNYLIDVVTDPAVPAKPAAAADLSGFKALLENSDRAVSTGSALENGVAKYYTTASDADGIELVAGSPPKVTVDLAAILPAEVATSHLAGELKTTDTITISFVVEIQ